MADGQLKIGRKVRSKLLFFFSAGVRFLKCFYLSKFPLEIPDYVPKNIVYSKNEVFMEKNVSQNYYDHAFGIHSCIIHPDTFLNWIYKELKKFKVQIKTIPTLKKLPNLPNTIIINCTGLGKHFIEYLFFCCLPPFRAFFYFVGDPHADFVRHILTPSTDFARHRRKNQLFFRVPHAG
jgi:hypothetical protein